MLADVAKYLQHEDFSTKVMAGLCWHSSAAPTDDGEGDRLMRTLVKPLRWLAATAVGCIVLFAGCVGLFGWSLAEHGRTALHTAAELNDVEIVRDWVRRRKNLDPKMQFRSTLEHQGDAGVTPLMLAAREGHGEAALMLIEAGARVDAESYRPSFSEFRTGVIYYALEGGNPDVVRAVLDGLGTHPGDESSRLLIHIALAQVCNLTPHTQDGASRVEVVRIVLARLARTGQAHAAVSDAAVYANCPGIIQLALDHEVRLTPAMVNVTIERDDVELLRRLIERGVDVSSAAQGSVHWRNTTPMIMAWQSHKAALIPVLLGAGADPNVAGSDGRTLLHVILDDEDRHDPETLDLVIAAGARSDLADRTGRTATAIAQQRFSKGMEGLPAAASAALQTQESPYERVDTGYGITAARVKGQHDERCRGADVSMQKALECVESSAHQGSPAISDR